MPFPPAVAEWDADVLAGDPLGFPGYEERLRTLASTGESVRTGRTEHYAFIEGRFEVLGGTMGAAAGERVVRAYDRARDLGLPMVVATRTGGARLQEGMVALVQLARTASAADRHAKAGLLSVGVYGSPTTGGVYASYGSLVDVRAAYEHAVVGFAGPRVAEGTLGSSLPATSHTAESAYRHALVDALVHPGEAAEWVDLALGQVERPLPTRPLPAWRDPGVDGAWGEVLRARAVGRPTGIDRAARLASSWCELRGPDPVVRAYDRARELRLPMVVATRTGGARMQEGMVSLVQLARTTSAADRHARAGLLSVGVYGSPTTGGVYASYGSLVDVRAAYEHAVIGFAGPRVAEGTLGISLPATSHTAESAYQHALVDALVHPGEAAEWVDVALGRLERPLPTRPLPAWRDPGVDGAWGEVLRARAVGRPTGIDRAARLATSWCELRGPDPVVRAGLATVADRRCVVVATDRYQRSGRPTPGGFRLARRAIALAGRLGLPVVTLIDTPGADPSAESEAHGLTLEIARTFQAMAACPSPTVSVCVGEGGSGGGLALSYADRLLMAEHAVFSVIAPEGAAAILERDATKAPDVAERLRLRSKDMLDLGIADEVVPEGQTALDRAVARALDAATPGDRERRFDRATARWLTP